MDDSRTLLSLIAGKFANSRREDLAVETLGYILSISQAARDALAEKLRSGNSAIAPVANVVTQAVGPDRGRPDLACSDGQANWHVLIEAKFWASLTDKQPNAYLDRLPTDVPSVLLFVAPAARLNSLWADLERRVSDHPHALTGTEHSPHFIYAAVSNSNRHLMLMSWAELLEGMARRAEDEDDVDAKFCINQLQGLAISEDVDAPFLPVRPEELNQEIPRRLLSWKSLVDGVVKEMERCGWAKPRNRRPSSDDTFEFYGRLLDFAGAQAWFGVNHQDWLKLRNTPLWIELYDTEEMPGDDDAWQRVRNLDEDISIDEANDIWHLPIFVPTDVELDEVQRCVVERLKRIAIQMHPDGPPYSQA